MISPSPLSSPLSILIGRIRPLPSRLTETGTQPSDRPMISAEVLADFNRIRITSALAEVCVEHGYHGATITHVCTEGKVARNTVYKYFGSKAEIFAALIERASDEIVRRIELGCAGAAPGLESGVAAGLGGAFGWIADNPAAARALLVESPTAGAIAAEVLVRTNDRCAELLRKRVPADLARTSIHEEFLVGGITTILRQAIALGEADRVPSMVPEMVTFATKSYLAGN